MKKFLSLVFLIGVSLNSFASKYYNIVEYVDLNGENVKFQCKEGDIIFDESKCKDDIYFLNLIEMHRCRCDHREENIDKIFSCYKYEENKALELRDQKCSHIFNN